MALDESANGLLSLAGTFLGLTTLTVFLRFFARFKQGSRISFDDVCMVAAWLGFVGVTACAFYAISKKFLGYPEPTDQNILDGLSVTIGKTEFTLDALGIWTVGMTKLSALFFFRRIFCSTGVRDIFNYVTILLIAIVAAWIVAFFILSFTFCGSHSFNWAVAPGHIAYCKIDYSYLVGTAISDFILEVLVLLVPIPKICSLHASTGRKLAICAVFSFALVGVAASATRMGIFLELKKEGRSKGDPFLKNTQSVYFITLEAAFNIVAVNGPTLWYFVSKTKAEDVLRSVRSLVSLRSGRASETSFGSKNATSHGPFALRDRRSESDSFQGLHDAKYTSADAYFSQSEVSPPPGIQVQYSIQHREDV